MNILVTGASGFIGSRLVEYLSKSDKCLRIYAHYRRPQKNIFPNVTPVISESLDSIVQNRILLNDIDVVVHLAAKVHDLNNLSDSYLEDYLSINSKITIDLATAAAAANVDKFIFLSSIKIFGDLISDSFLDSLSIPNPTDPYGISKRKAEVLLDTLSKKTDLSYFSLRIPLVYGPNVRANFLNLIKLVDSSLPLPFASISNSRSYIYIENLLDAINRLIETNIDGQQEYLLCDGDNISTPDLIRSLSRKLDSKTILFRCESKFLERVCSIFGQEDKIKRLTQSLVIDPSRIKNDLDWIPPFTIEQGLHITTSWYLKKKKVNNFRC